MGFKRALVARAEIRPIPKPDAPYNEHQSPRITYGLGMAFMLGAADAVKRPGIYVMDERPQVTIQDFIAPAERTVHGTA